MDAKDFLPAGQVISTGGIILPKGKNEITPINNEVSQQLEQIEPFPEALTVSSSPYSWTAIAGLVTTLGLLLYFGINAPPFALCALVACMLCAIYGIKKVMEIPYDYNHDMNEKGYRELKQVAEYNPKVASYITAKANEKTPLTKRDYYYLGIDRQIKIIKNAASVKRLKALVTASPLMAEDELAEQLSKIKVERFPLLSQQEAKWEKSVLHNKVMICLLITTWIINFAVRSQVALGNAENLIVALTLLFTMLSIMYLMISFMNRMEQREIAQDYIYDLDIYDEIGLISRYKLDNREYLKQVIAENRPLTNNDLSNLNLKAQMEAISCHRLKKDIL